MGLLENASMLARSVLFRLWERTQSLAGSTGEPGTHGTSRVFTGLLWQGTCSHFGWTPVRLIYRGWGMPMPSEVKSSFCSDPEVSMFLA